MYPNKDKIKQPVKRVSNVNDQVFSLVILDVSYVAWYKVKCFRFALKIIGA